MTQHWHRKLIRTVAAVGLVLAGSGIAATSAAPTASAGPSLCIPANQHDSRNWAGIIDYCHTYYLAKGTFTATCAANQAGSIVSYFAGIGGVLPGSQLIQTAVTDLVYTSDGTHHFKAVAETHGTSHPAPIDITPPGGIKCGDHILLSVVQWDMPWNTGNQFYQVYNNTTRQHSSRYVYRSTDWPGSDRRTAEFIIERPTLDNPPNPACPYAPLTKWGLWPIPNHLQTSYLSPDGVHPDVPMTSAPYSRSVMWSCDGQHILEEPDIKPQYDDMWMFWRAAS